MSESETEKKLILHEPDRALTAKVGTGAIEAAKLERAEKAIAEDKTDFAPLGQTILARLQADLAAVRTALPADRGAVAKLTAAVMDIKAGAGTFRYVRLAEISALLLRLLDESIELNEDGVNIVEAYCKIAGIFFAHQMTGDAGQSMAIEFSGACERYRARHLAAP